MARILISEPHLPTRKTIARMATHLGHEPVLARVPTPEHFAGFDVYIFDTAGSFGATLARAAQQAALATDQSLALIGTGVEPPPQDFQELGIALDAWLSKPFTREQLREAIERALAGPV